MRGITVAAAVAALTMTATTTPAQAWHVPWRHHSIRVNDEVGPGPFSIFRDIVEIKSRGARNDEIRSLRAGDRVRLTGAITGRFLIVKHCKHADGVFFSSSNPTLVGHCSIDLSR